MRSIRAITVGSIAAGALLAVCAGAAPAKADWHHGGGWHGGPGFGVSIGPAYYPPAYYAPPPVYYAPPPAYSYYAPPPPVYVAPPSLAFGIHIR